MADLFISQYGSRRQNHSSSLQQIPAQVEDEPQSLPKKSEKSRKVCFTKSDFLSEFGKIIKQALCPISQSGYSTRKRFAGMTAHKYGDGESRRLLVARETLKQTRNKLPIVIITVDGVIGYWDE